MTVIVSYEIISPTLLERIVRDKVMNAFCLWKAMNEDYFEFSVSGWFPLAPNELVKIESILAEYV